IAVLEYQHENRADEAIAQLKSLAKQREKYDEADVVEILVHLAAAERAAGAPERALEAANDALSIKSDEPGAHLQATLVLLDRKDAPASRVHLKALGGKLKDPMLELLLEGRILLAEGNAAAAMDRFDKAAALDPRRADARLLAGAAAALGKNAGLAYDRVMKQALKADPLKPGPVPLMARQFVRPSD